MRILVTINCTRKTVRIGLSASLTDPMALSVTREWGCVCPPDGSAAGSHYSSVPPCPYCAAVAQAEIVSAVARENGTDVECTPFFPTASGNAANEDHVVASVEQTATAVSDTVRDESGRRKFTGHTFRVQGAQFLAAMGLELFKIQLLARWASPIIMRYAAAAPLQAVTGDFRRLRQQATLDDVIKELRDLLKRAGPERKLIADLPEFSKL